MDLFFITVCNIVLFFIEHSGPLDVDKMNREKIDADCNLWDALESSKWLPCEMLDVA